MNFLSHFYFDRHCNDAYHVLGSVMPDLLRNADKNAQIRIERLSTQNDAAINSIISGWKKHLEIDRHFHSSQFFKTHAHQLKLLFVPILAGSEVKPFFLGHIALELILDNLLLTSNTVFADDFYDHLKNTETDRIADFLRLNHVHPQQFLNFYASFINQKYLYSYRQLDSIVHALKGVCQRIWKNPFTKTQEAELIEAVRFYTDVLTPEYKLIFDETEILIRN